MFSGSRLAHTQLGVLAAAPVNRKHDVTRFFVDIDDDGRACCFRSSPRRHAAHQLGCLRQAAVRGPAQVLAYLGRYTHRVAIANSRLVALDQDYVAFSWRDYRHNGTTKIMKLKPDEFNRRLNQPHRREADIRWNG